jgi:hypothetical protein
MTNPCPIQVWPRELLGIVGVNNPMDIARRFFTAGMRMVDILGAAKTTVLVITQPACLAFEPGTMNLLQSDDGKLKLRAAMEKIAVNQYVQGIGVIYTGKVKSLGREVDALVAQCEWNDGTSYTLVGELSHTATGTIVGEPRSMPELCSRFSDLFPPPAGTVIN